MDCKRAFCKVPAACALGFLFATCGLFPAALAVNTPNVTVYMSPDSGVLDLEWDMSAVNVELQLRDLGLAVTAAVDGQPPLTGAHAPDAYIIPYQNGNVFYVSAEDMRGVASYVAAGGLVILLDAATGEGAATRDFVSQSLKLKGDWYLCRAASTPKSSTKRFALSRLGDGIEISAWAHSFLRDADPAAAAADSGLADAEGSSYPFTTGTPWPRRLEDSPRVVSTHTLCVHEDPALISQPLYTVRGDEMRVAAQAFSRAGTPGAVVWLGYSWKDGPQEQWGSLIRKLVTDFARGAFKVPSEADAEGPLHEADAGDRLVEAVADAAGSGGATADLVRLLLEGAAGVYPPPPSPSPPSSPGSGSSK